MGGAGSQLFVAQEYSLGDEVGKLNRNEEIRDAKAQKRSFVSYETPQSAEEMCLGSDISILMYTFVHPYSVEQGTKVFCTILCKPLELYLTHVPGK